MFTRARSTVTYDLSSDAFFAVPEVIFRRMQENDPVYFDAGLDAWVLSRYRDVRDALRDPRLSVDRNGQIGKAGSQRVRARLSEVNRFFCQWMVFADPPLHTRLRSLVAREFQPQVVSGMQGTIDEIASALLDSVDPEGPFDVLADYAVPLTTRVTARLLGLPDQSESLIKDWTARMFELFGAGTVSDELAEHNCRAVREFCSFFREIIERRKRRPQADLISRIIEHPDNRLTEEEVLGLCITLVAGSYETTTHLITNGLYALLRFPRERSRLQAEPRLIADAVEELLRFDGPALSVQRRALTELELSGHRILEGDRVYCMLHAANHDPTAFDDPECLDIQRTGNRQLGLGIGPHFCLGAWVTRLETQRALILLLERYPKLALCSGFSPKWTGNLAIRGLERLAVQLKPPAQRAVPASVATSGSGQGFPV